MTKIVGITGIKISHPVLGDQVFKDIKHFEFDETGPIESRAIDKPVLTTWSGSGIISLSKKQAKQLKRWIASLPKQRIPRKKKKALKLLFAGNIGAKAWKKHHAEIENYQKQLTPYFQSIYDKWEQTLKETIEKNAADLRQSQHTKQNQKSTLSVLKRPI